MRAARRERERGLTLLEMGVAMLVVTLLVTMSVMSVEALTGAKARSAAGELAGTIRSLYDTASLTGKTCRLVFHLPGEREEEGGAVRYSAECAQGAITTSRDRDEVLRQAGVELGRRERESDRDRRRREEEEADRARRGGDGEPSLQDLLAEEKERVEAAARFQGFQDPQVKPRELPSGVQVSVWTRHQREPARSGLAYLYFFPQGYTERAQVTFRQGSNAWTIQVAPLTGKTSMAEGELEVPR